MNPIFKSKDGTLIDLSNVVMINPFDIIGRFSSTYEILLVSTTTTISWYLQFKCVSNSQVDSLKLHHLSFCGAPFDEENMNTIQNHRILAQSEYDRFVQNWEEIKKFSYQIYASQKT